MRVVPPFGMLKLIGKIEKKIATNVCDKLRLDEKFANKRLRALFDREKNDLCVCITSPPFQIHLKTRFVGLPGNEKGHGTVVND